VHEVFGGFVKKVYVLLMFAFLLTKNATAQVAAASDAPATREDVVKLFELMHVQQQTQSAIESMLKQQRVMVREALRKRHPEISEEELKSADKYMDDFWRDFPVAQMLDDMIPVYQKHLTKTDVGAMSIFYASPTGQKLLREMPAIMTESMQAMMPHLQESMDKMMERVEQKTEEEQKKAPPGEKN
jgi:hypothetical protein